MLEVYVRHIDEKKGRWLGAFSTEKIKELPELFDMFETSSANGETCQMVDTHFVLGDRTTFEIVVEPIQQSS